MYRDLKWCLEGINIKKDSTKHETKCLIYQRVN